MRARRSQPARGFGVNRQGLCSRNIHVCAHDPPAFVELEHSVDRQLVVAPFEYLHEDRRPLAHLTHGVDGELVNARFLRDGGWHPVRTPLATAGDRLLLQHFFVSTGEPGAESEIEALHVAEVDDEGRFMWVAVFDAADRAAASAELFERYVAGGAQGMPVGAAECVRGWNAHDLGRARTGLCDDLVLDDRRRTGMGRLEGADAYIASVAAIQELIPDAREEILYSSAVASHGRVSVMRRAGANTEGGAVESIFVVLMLYRGERVARFEVFELEHLGAAIERLEELREATTA